MSRSRGDRGKRTSRSNQKDHDASCEYGDPDPEAGMKDIPLKEIIVMRVFTAHMEDPLSAVEAKFRLHGIRHFRWSMTGIVLWVSSPCVT